MKGKTRICLMALCLSGLHKIVGRIRCLHRHPALTALKLNRGFFPALRERQPQPGCRQLSRIWCYPPALL
ncbi:hypothetical protein FDX10_13825 [Citrobacter sp. wls713]|nr:hypothetical protein [Citrobacter braakii]TKU64666.1 hypothetical protein FDX10_13825 [Citrobacter sp. wls713]TKU99138.1 hypothetical protein FDX07_15070 [Citrobacter sp. wls621]